MDRLVLLIVLACSLTLNVALSWRLKESQPAQAGIPASATFGQVIPHRSPASKGTLLYVYSPSCKFCKQHNTDIREVASLFPSLKVIAVSIAKEPDPMFERELPANVDLIKLGEFSPKLSAQIVRGITALTPQTILYGVDGQARFAQNGIFDAEKKDRLIQLIKSI